MAVALGSDDEEVGKTGSHGLAVLVSFSAVINLTKSNVGEEWVHLTYRLQSVIKRSKGRNSGRRRSQEMKQRCGGRQFPGLLPLPSSVTFLMQPRTPCDSTAHSRLAPHITVSCVKKMPYRHGHRQAP